MRLRDVAHISTKSLKAQPRRTFFLIVSTGVVFGLVLMVNLWWQGLQNTYIEYASRATNGKVVLWANELTSGSDGMAGQDGHFGREEIIQDLQKFGAKILGDAQIYGAYGGLVLGGENFSGLIEIDTKKAPKDAAPILVSDFLAEQLIGEGYSGITKIARQKQQNYEDYRAALLGKVFADGQGDKYFVVGFAPGSSFIDNLSFEQIIYKNDSVFNPFLRNIPTLEGIPIVINNGADGWKVTSFEEMTGGASVVASFESLDKANEYLEYGKGEFMSLSLLEREYSVRVVAGMSPETDYIFRQFSMVINIASIVLIVVAGIVVVFTAIRLVDQDCQNIRLYYSIGADSRQVRMLYLCYFVELMVGVLVFALAIASVMVILFNVIYRELLGIQAMLAFSLAEVPFVVWYGVNIEILVILGIILLMAPVCVLVGRKILSR